MFNNFITIFLLLAVNGFLLAASPGKSSNATDSEFPAIIDTNRIIQEPQLCGVNCIYLGYKVLGRPVASYDQIMDKFPNVIRLGVSLKELQDYLKNQGFNTEISLTNELAISKDLGTVSIVLLSSVKPNHLVLKHSDGKGGIIVLDPPFNTNAKSKGQLSEVKMPTLTFGKEPIHKNFTANIFISSFFAVLLIVCGILLLFFRSDRFYSYLK